MSDALFFKKQKITLIRHQKIKNNIFDVHLATGMTSLSNDDNRGGRGKVTF
jgi:hypothetical protein